MVSAVDSAKDQSGTGSDRNRVFGSSSGCASGTAMASSSNHMETHCCSASGEAAAVGRSDPAPVAAGGSGCAGGSRSSTPQGRRRKRVTQAKRHSNVFLKHKMKYKKKSSAQEDSSSSTESERATPVVGRTPPVTFLPGAVLGDCCDDDELYRPSAMPAALRPNGEVVGQSPVERVTQAAASLPPPPLLPPISTLCDPSTAPGTAAAVEAAAGMPLGRSGPSFFKCIPSVSSTLSTTSSHSSAASAEKEGSDSSDSLVSAKATQRRSLKKAAAAAAAAATAAGISGGGPTCGSVEKEGGSDSSDSPASCASASRKSIKKLIRNKYDIFRRHKLKYRQLLGKGSTRSDKHLDYSSACDDVTAVDGNTASTSLHSNVCTQMHANGRCQSMGNGPASNGSSSSSNSSSSSSSSTRHSAAVAADAHTFHLPGPRGLPHNSLLHSSSSSGNQSSSSLQSSSSASRSSRDNGSSASDRARAERRHPSPAIINRVVPLMVMVQRQTVEGDSSSSALMFKCNMCNMYSNLMRNVLMHISERHATAQYCFDCESFFPDEHSLDSHRSIGCQGGCSVSHAGSDVPTVGEGSESPSSSSSSGICLKEGTGGATNTSETTGTTTADVAVATGSNEKHDPGLGADAGSAVHDRPAGLVPATALPARLPRPRHSYCAATAILPVVSHTDSAADNRRADVARSNCSSTNLNSVVGNRTGDRGTTALSLRSAFSASSSSLSSSAFTDVASMTSSTSNVAGLVPTLPAIHETGSEAGKEYRCRLCNKEFLGSCYLKRHMRSHTGEKICFCPICHRGFSEWRNLRNHIARFHNGGLRGRSTSRSSGSDNGRAASVASGMSTSTSGFSESLAAEPHVAGSSSAPAADDVADIAVAAVDAGEASDAEDTAADEVPDMEHVIVGSPDSKDSNQLMSMDAENDMLQHSTMQLGSTSSRLELNSDETFRKKALTPHDCVGGLRRTYHCEPCNKDFVTKFAMQRHLDFHADKRPFHCDMCSYKSKTKPQLKVHQMRHKGQKVYHCDLCNYDCVTHSDLNRHCKSMSHKSRHRADAPP